MSPSSSGRVWAKRGTKDVDLDDPRTVRPELLSDEQLQQFLDNSKTITYKQPLQMSLLRHIESSNVVSFGKFAKNPDPIDRLEQVNKQIQKNQQKEMKMRRYSKQASGEALYTKPAQDNKAQLIDELEHLQRTRPITKITPRKYHEVEIDAERSTLYPYDHGKSLDNGQVIQTKAIKPNQLNF